MVEKPGLTLLARPSETWSAEGPLASRVLAIAERLVNRRHALPPARLTVLHAPPEHVGLGVGTQLGLGVARLLTTLAGDRDLSVTELAELAGRGLRSGIGVHGFAEGGLIVDGGRGSRGIPPRLARLAFPGDWHALVVLPPQPVGLHGPREIQAFADLPPSSDRLTDRLCRIVLLGFLPAVAERDLPGFGEALEELQALVGQGFAPAQGGAFARPELETIAGILRDEGLVGVGQSSWGPALYGFSDADEAKRMAVRARIVERVGLGLDATFWTRASERGAQVAISVHA
jgi:beta-RFAP synthase